MMFKRAFFIIILCGSFSFGAGAQDSKEMERLVSSFESKTETHDHSLYLKNSSNEFEFLVSGAFLAYKTFISSQDGVSCVFHPSCSAYAMESFRRYGILKGVLNSFDRLCRCNGLSPELYEKHTETNLLYDPVH